LQTTVPPWQVPVSRRFKETVEARDAAESARRVSEEGRVALEAEIEALRAEIAAAKIANQTVADTHDYREAETRDLFIDLLLREAGFDPKAPDTVEVEVMGMPNAPGVGYVDYRLRGMSRWRGRSLGPDRPLPILLSSSQRRAWPAAGRCADPCACASLPPDPRKALAPEHIDQAIVERFYQHRAIGRIAEAFERDKQRKALLVMATGAGKPKGA
jgi:type I restriction enzyme R subunit